MPSLAAHAQLVSVEIAEGYTKPLTGTSASTATIAGIASLIWSYAPELTPAQVMQTIHASGTETPLTADFGFAGDAGVRRASVCAALERACIGRPEGHCPTLACDEAPLARSPALVAGSIEQAQVCEATPWTERVSPQPLTPPCPMCMIDDDELQLILDDDYDGLTLENVTVELYDEEGGLEEIDYGDLPVTSSSVYTVTDSDLQTVDRSGLPPVTAWVQMEFTDYSNPTAPVTVYAGNEITVQ